MDAVPSRISRPMDVSGLSEARGGDCKATFGHFRRRAGLDVPGRFPCMAVVTSLPAEEDVGRLVPGRAKPVSGRPLALTGRTTWVGPPPLSSVQRTLSLSLRLSSVPV